MREWVRRLIGIATCLLFAGGCHDAPRTAWDISHKPVPRRQITFVSYNIYNNRGDADQVLKTLRDSDADIILLQEVPDNDFEPMKQSLGYPFGYYARDLWGKHPNVNRDAKSRGQAILSRFPMRNAEPIPNAGEGTRGIWAEVEAEGRTFVVASVHLSSTWKITPGHVYYSFDARARELTRFFNAWTLRDRPPIVMGGDFNNPPLGEAYSIIRRTLRDTHREAGVDRPTIYHGPIGLRIDYMLCSTEWEIVDAGVIDDRGSDHRAVRLSVRGRPR